MGKPKACPDPDFIRLFEELGPTGTADRLGVNIRKVFERRENLERVLGRQIVTPRNGQPGNYTRVGAKHPGRIELNIPNGIVLVGSDAHIWPGPTTPAMRGFVKFCQELKPRAIVLNGDVLDACTISRHPPIGWEKRPTLVQEIEAAQEQLHEIEKVTPKGCERIWTLGNHDSRFETRIATVAPEFAKIAGVHLSDHFPLWQPCWSAWINGDTVIKHRFKNGIHAVHNATLWSGKTILNGHLHSLKVAPFTDYAGTRWGVDTGCLADTDARAFLDYTEDNPKNWRAGFIVLTFKDGRLLWPEIVSVFDDNHIEFRGQVLSV